MRFKIENNKTSLYDNDMNFLYSNIQNSTLSIEGNKIAINPLNLDYNIRVDYDDCYDINGVRLGNTVQEVALALDSTFFFSINESNYLHTTGNETATGIKTFDQIGLNLTGFTPNEGFFAWDSEAGTVQIGMPGSDVRLQVGQEMHIRAVNAENSTIANGSLVYIFGASGQKPQVKKAMSNVAATSSVLIGMATENILKNQQGYITLQGIVRDVNTNGIAAGTQIYLSESSAGSFTSTKPTAPNYTFAVGVVLYEHATEGKIYIHINREWIRFGTDANYSYFEADGTLVCKGNAITYRDEFPGGDYVPASAAAAPDLENYTIGGVGCRKYAFDGNNTVERLSNSIELPHDGCYTDQANYPIEIHIHFRPSTIGTGVVKWFIDWSWDKANTGDAPIAQTTLSNTFEIPANKQYCHYILSIGNLPNQDYKLGDLINFNVRRDPTDPNDTYAADVIFEQVAIHIPCDTLGSRTIYLK